MVTPDQEKWILEKAYVPEHIVRLMTIISKGEPFLLNGYLFYVGDTWGILVGYPLDSGFSQEKFMTVFMDVSSLYSNRSWSLIAPELPEGLHRSCGERQSDTYFTLTYDNFDSKESLRRIAEKATSRLMVEVTRVMGPEHKTLIKEFVEREKPDSLIEEFYHAMPGYVRQSSATLVLNARGFYGGLSAFYVLDFGADNFATYVVGCHSKEHYVPHASDLLFFEMVNMARESGKAYVQLGLGVNQGIRRFKEKWGGKPTLAYELCRIRSGMPGVRTMIDSILSRL